MDTFFDVIFVIDVLGALLLLVIAVTAKDKFRKKFALVMFLAMVFLAVFMWVSIKVVRYLHGN